jgi:hypothetical protein
MSIKWSDLEKMKQSNGYAGGSSAVTLTMTKEEREAEGYINTVLRLHRELSLLRDLRPSECVNRLFNELVTLCTTTLSEAVTKMVLPTHEQCCYVTEV